jgi:hypothetical protein
LSKSLSIVAGNIAFIIASQPVTMAKSIGAGGHKLFLLVTYHGAESLNVVRRYGDLWASKRITDAKLWKLLFVTKPQLPVELLDARIAALHNLVNRGVGL